VRSPWPAVIILVAIAACDVLTGLKEGIRVETGSERFSLDSRTGSAKVPYTVFNERSTVFLARCGGSLRVELEQWKNGTWVNARTAFCTTNLDMSAIRLRPDEERSDSLTVHARGRYRLRLGVTRSADRPYEWKLVSHPFVLE
jgi:hypothetical protein